MDIERTDHSGCCKFCGSMTKSVDPASREPICTYCADSDLPISFPINKIHDMEARFYT